MDLKLPASSDSRRYVMRQTRHALTLALVRQVYGFASVASGMAAIWSLMCLTVERALVICRAGYQRTSRTTMKRVILAIWSLALAAATPPLAGWNKYVYEVGWLK